MPDPTEVWNHIRRVLAEQNVHMPPAQLTPAFPKAWPPTGDGTIVHFVFSSRALPTGMEMHEVYSPSLRVEVDLTTAGDPAPTVSALTSQVLSPPQSIVLEPVQRDAIVEAERLLFRAVTTPPATGSLPTGPQARTLRETYRTWLQQNTALAEHLKGELPEFFAWLEQQP